MTDSAPAAPPRPRKSRRIKLLAAFAFLIVAAWLAAPPFVRSRSKTAAEAALGVPVDIGEISFNLFTGTAELRDVVVHNPPGFDRPHALKIGRLHVDAALTTVLSPAARVEAVQAEDIELVVILAKGDAVNLRPIFDRLNGEAPASPGSTPASGQGPGEKPKGLVIDRIDVTRLTVRVVDFNVGAPCHETALEKGRLEVTDVHVRDGATGEPTRALFTGEIRCPQAPAPVRMEGKCGVLGGPLDFDLKGTLRKFDVAAVEPYTTASVTALVGGTHSLDADVNAQSRASILKSEITVTTGNGEQYSVRVSGPLAAPKAEGDSVVMNAFRLPFVKILGAAGAIVGQGAGLLEAAGALGVLEAGGKAVVGAPVEAAQAVGGAAEDVGEFIGDTVGGIFGGKKEEKKPEEKPPAAPKKQ